MRMIFAICIALLVAGGLVVWKALQLPDQYGTFTGAPRAEVAALVEKPETFLGKTITVAGTIKEQCKSMGCFFYFDGGKRPLRVDLQDIAMTAPKREGHSARVEGRIMPYGDGYQLFASAVRFE